MNLPALPEFKNTEHAVRFGAFMTRDQFIQISGARDALQREFDRLNERHHQNVTARGFYDKTLMQIMSDLATTLGKLREALEAAPVAVLASMIAKNCSDGSQLVFERGTCEIREPIEVGHL